MINEWKVKIIIQYHTIGSTLLPKLFASSLFIYFVLTIYWVSDIYVFLMKHDENMYVVNLFACIELTHINSIQHETK